MVPNAMSATNEPTKSWTGLSTRQSERRSACGGSSHDWNQLP
jgi:hypothetical protein